MERLRTAFLLPWRDSASLARRFPKCALHVLRDAVFGPWRVEFPRRIGLFLTDRCNFACPMCAVVDIRREGLARGGEMRLEIAENVLEQCSRDQPVIDLIGGEPLLYSRIADILQMVARRRVMAALTTNGLKLSQFARQLVDSRLPILQVSLDGWDEASQTDRGKVPGSFEPILAGIRAVLDARGGRRFPVVRVLTAITRTNHASLDRIGSLVASLGVQSWGVANYFYVNSESHRAHLSFALRHGLPSAVTAHAIEGDVYLTPAQVADLRSSLGRVRRNRGRVMKIGYAWRIDPDAYYSARQPSNRVCCELPYNRLDIHSDGSTAVCVSGKRLGTVGNQSIAEVWRGRVLAEYRRMYARERPMPMCFRCCGLSQTIRL